MTKPQISYFINDVTLKPTNDATLKPINDVTLKPRV
jgi:hypothetical protein